MGRIICELERIYGVKNGGDRKSENFNNQGLTKSSKVDPLITQKHLAETMGTPTMKVNKEK